MNDDKNIELPKNPPITSGGREAGVNIIIAGGGTGGHIFPAVAIANAIKKIDRKSVV